MELIKETPLEVGWLVWEPNPGRTALTVVVKATFDLPAEGDATLASEQRLLEGDEHHEDDIEQSLGWASDLEPLKPRGECYVVGSFHAPHGLPVDRSALSFTIGPVSKQLAVIGDRVWRAGRASEPRPFTTMPLRWERSFGGAGVPANPLGRGLGKELPNIESVGAQIQARDQHPPPAGCAPIPRTWKARMRWAGTYDADWLAQRYPGLAEDVDYRLFMCAPEDQRIEGFWRGDEVLLLRHLHPVHPKVTSRLPDIRANAFLANAEGTLTDVGLRLDTIVIDADAGQAVCLWRGLTDVRADLAGIEHLFVVHQEGGETQKLADYEAAYRAALDAAAKADEDEEPETPPDFPEDMPTMYGTADAASVRAELARRAAAVAALATEKQPFVDPEAPGAKWAHLDQAMTALGDDAALTASLSAELEKRRQEERSAAFRPVFEDALGIAPRPPAEPELTPEELLDLEMLDALGDLGDGEEQDDRKRVKAAVRAGESCAGWELFGVDLSGLELTGGDFTGALLARANLSGVYARDATFDGASLIECELSHAVFEGCSFVETDLSPARAERIRMSGCTLDGATAADTYFSNARFVRCTFVGADFTASDLTEAHFEECSLDSIDLSSARIPKAQFIACTLVDAWLEGVNAERAVFDRCDCTLLRASEGAVFEGASFKRAKLEGARFSTSKLRGADFSLAYMPRADFSGALLAQAKLMGCDLRAARFDGAILVQASLLKSNLHQARFENANLKHADLRGCNLFQAELLGAELSDARFDLAYLHGTRIA